MIRAVLLVAGVSQLAVGVLAFVAPGAFYDLLAGYPPENHHFLMDIGSWNVALGAITVYGAGRQDWQVPLLGFLALQYGLHTISHIVDLNDAEEDWQGWFALVTQGFGAIVLAALFLREQGRVRKVAR